jgi:hypothetical protein
MVLTGLKFLLFNEVLDLEEIGLIRVRDFLSVVKDIEILTIYFVRVKGNMIWKATKVVWLGPI